MGMDALPSHSLNQFNCRGLLHVGRQRKQKDLLFKESFVSRRDRELQIEKSSRKTKYRML